MHFFSYDTTSVIHITVYTSSIAFPISSSYTYSQIQSTCRPIRILPRQLWGLFPLSRPAMSAIGHDSAIVVELRSGVEHVVSVMTLNSRIRRSISCHMLWYPFGSQHNADRQVLSSNSSWIWFMPSTQASNIHDIILHTRQYDLSLRIPESRIYSGPFGPSP